MTKLVAQDNVKRKLWQIGIEPIDSYGKIDLNIGLRKGDLIVFAGPGDPRRFSSGSVAGKVMITDPNAPLGWVLGSPGGNPTVTIKNASNAQVIAGRAVAITYSATEPSFVLATNASTTPLYITADDSGAGDSVECYGVNGTIVPVLCEGTVAVGNYVAVTSTGYCGKATSASNNIIGIALTKKTTADGYALVKVLLTGAGGIENTSGQETGDKLTTFSGTSLTVQDEYEHRNNTAIGALTITLPASPSAMFYCTVSFTANASFTGVKFKKGTENYTIKNVGHALTKKGVRYNLAIWWDGVYYWCSTKTA